MRLGNAVYILTNKHVSTVRNNKRVLAYQFDGQDDIRRVVGNHVDFTAPLDLGLLPVDMPSWNDPSNGSKAIGIDQIALTHSPVEREVMTFAGFAGEKVSFNFDQLNAQSTCYTARQIDLPHHADIDPRFHFGLDYNPGQATTIIGNSGLPTPPGLSGSTVWDTGFVKAKMTGEPWMPDLARVTGVV